MIDQNASLESLVSVFEGMVDFRIERHKKYGIGEILFATLSAVISGFTEWEEIEDFGEEKLEWLRNFYPFKMQVTSLHVYAYHPPGSGLDIGEIKNRRFARVCPVFDGVLWSAAFVQVGNTGKQARNNL